MSMWKHVCIQVGVCDDMCDGVCRHWCICRYECVCVCMNVYICKGSFRCFSSPGHWNLPLSPQGSSFVTRGCFGDRQSGPRNAHCLGLERILVPTRLSSCYAFSLLTTQRSVIAEDEAIATQSFGFIETMDLDGPRFPQ